ncbi:hypothetical protein TWF751_007165 [Orbilia oligospora]|nr:hypothetical protein TWF751_007165 [Orbilia oligospora]
MEFLHGFNGSGDVVVEFDHRMMPNLRPDWSEGPDHRLAKQAIHTQTHTHAQGWEWLCRRPNWEKSGEIRLEYDPWIVHEAARGSTPGRSFKWLLEVRTAVSGAQTSAEGKGKVFQEVKFWREMFLLGISPLGTPDFRMCHL